MKTEHAIEYLTIKLQVNKLTGLLGEQNEVAEISIKALQENEQLHELLRLAVADMRGICNFCKKRNDCISHKGSHKYCWQWQHSDKLKELGVEI